MSLNESRVEQARRDLVRLRERVARASKTIADERKKAADERGLAAKSRSANLAGSHQRRADAAEARAVRTEAERASLDSDIARTEKKLYDALAAVDRERAAALTKRLREQALSAPHPTPARSPLRAAPRKKWDFFVSHASPDKDVIVRALVDALTEQGAGVWYDDFELRVGDSLRRKIDEGLANSRFGIVVLTPAYLAGRRWTEEELNGLFSTDKRILPIWHHVSRDEVAAYSPMLADRVAFVTAVQSLDEIVRLLMELLEVPPE